MASIAKTTGVTEIAKGISLADDRPLNAEENFTLELMRRRITSGFFDESGRFFKPPAASGATTQPAPAAPDAAPSAATGGVITAGSGYVAPALSLTRVQPGDLITAGFINGIIDTLLVLDDRLRELEANSGRVVTPAVTPATPATPPAPPTPKSRFNVLAATAAATTGQKSVTVTVTGTGLAPDGLRSIQLGRLTVDLRTVKGNDTLIKFLVPAAQMQLVGATKTVVITNEAGEEDSAQLKTSGRTSLLDNFR